MTGSIGKENKMSGINGKAVEPDTHSGCHGHVNASRITPDMVAHMIRNTLEKSGQDISADALAASVRFARTMHTLHVLPALLDQHFHKLMLSKARIMVMMVLFHIFPEGESISELCTLHPVSPATLTGVADTLEREGLLERIPCKSDRRRVQVRLTAQGVDFMKRLVPIHHRNTTRIIEGLQVDEQENLVHLLEKLVTHVADLIHTDAFELPPLPDPRKGD